MVLEQPFRFIKFDFKLSRRIGISTVGERKGFCIEWKEYVEMKLIRKTKGVKLVRRMVLYKAFCELYHLIQGVMLRLELK